MSEREGYKMFGTGYNQPPQGYGDPRYMQPQNPYERRLGSMEAERRPVQNVNWIPVGGYDDVRGIMVQPGVTVWAMDNNEPIFYVKTADQMGVCTIDAYRYERIQVGGAPAPQNVGYITREEYENLIARIERMENGGAINAESFNQQNHAGNVADGNAAADGGNAKHVRAVPAVSPADGGT
jgi:hypothetical protein